MVESTPNQSATVAFNNQFGEIPTFNKSAFQPKTAYQMAQERKHAQNEVEFMRETFCTGPDGKRYSRYRGKRNKKKLRAV